MSSSESPIAGPDAGWARRFPRDEKIFFLLILVSGVLMTVFAIGWLVWGSQNVPTKTAVVNQKAFAAQVNAFAKEYAYEGKVWVPPGKTGYLLAYRFGWTPELAIQEDVKTTIWISSADVLHGFSIVGQNLNLQVAPKHGFGATITPDSPGRYRIICNEYCGLGHQRMTNFIDVVTAEEMAAAQKAIAASGGGESGASGGGGTTSGALEISAASDNTLAFDVNALTAKAGSVTITLSNPSSIPHNVAIKGSGVDVKGEIVGTGGTSTATADLEPGTYTFYCSVPGHEAAGMKGTLTVN